MRGTNVVTSRVEDLHKYKKTIILAIIMLVPNNNPQEYKEHIIYFIVFDFGEGVKSLIGWKKWSFVC